MIRKNFCGQNFQAGVILDKILKFLIFFFYIVNLFSSKVFFILRFHMALTFQ